MNQSPYGSIRESTPTRQSQQLGRTNPPTTADSQTRFNLYSEIEKLTVLNLDLKKQNENLIREMEKQSFLIGKIPELESKIIDLERELSRKESSISQNLRDNDYLRKDLNNMQKLEQAYNELFAHNKRLLSEIDDLNVQLERALHDKERADAENASTFAKLNDALKRLDAANIDLDERQKEVYNLKDQNKLLNDKVRGAAFENDRLQGMLNDSVRENNYLKSKQNELEREHSGQVVNMNEKIENEKRNNYDLTTKYLTEKNHLENELKHAQQRIDELQHRLSMSNAENDKLHKLNLDNNSEIEALNRSIYENQKKSIEDQERLEKDRRNQLDNQGKELTLEMIRQKQQYEDRIGGLKSEINELQKLHDVIHEKDKEIDNLKIQNNYNERAWDRKLQNTVESERATANARAAAERGELQNEINSHKNKINELEKKISLLTSEIDRLTSAHQEREREIREQRNNLVLQERDSRLAFEDLKNSLNVEKSKELDDLEMGLRRVYEAQLDLLKDRIGDLEDKIARLADENTKLANTNEERTQEIELHKYRIKVQEEKYNNYVQDTDRIHADKTKAAILKEVANVEADKNIELAKCENKIAEQDREIVNFKNKIRALEAEISRLGNILNHRDQLVDSEKKKVIDMDTQKAQELAELKKSIDIIQAASVDTATAIAKTEAEKLFYATQVKQQRERIEQLEKRLALLAEENERLRAVYNEKVEHLEDLRKGFIEMQGITEKEKNALIADIDNLRFARLNIEEITIRHASEKAQYENQIRQLKTLADNNKEEIDKLYELLGSRKRDHVNLMKSAEDLKHTNDDLSANNRAIDSENHNQRDINDRFGKKIEALEKERDLYRSKNDQLNVELNNTIDDLRQKGRDVDDLKKKYDKSMEMTSKFATDLIDKLAKKE